MLNCIVSVKYYRQLQQELITETECKTLLSFLIFSLSPTDTSLNWANTSSMICILALKDYFMFYHSVDKWHQVGFHISCVIYTSTSHFVLHFWLQMAGGGSGGGRGALPKRQILCFLATEYQS